MKRILLTASLLLAFPAAAPAEDWPHWRGPRLDGTSAETGLPVKWSATENVAWKTPIPGTGHSSPIVHGDRVFVTSALVQEQKRVLLCLDRKTGKVLWKRDVVETPAEPKHKLNSYASSTPATDGKHVWVTFVRLRKKAEGEGPPTQPRERSPVPADLVPEMVAACYTMDGEKVWERVPGRFYSRHGFCSPPIPYKDTIILNGDQDAAAFLVALDRATGEERWRVDRPNRTRSYCAPLIVEAGGRTQMVLSGSMTVTSYDPDTGKLLWKLDGPTEQFVASLVYADGVFFLTAGFPDYHNMGISPEGKVLWHESRTVAKKAAYVPSPVAHAETFFMMSDLGWLSAFETTTGKRRFMERLGPHHSASPVVADGRLYIIDDDGVTHVLAAGPTFEPLARNPLGEECYASPAVSRGQLFIRTANHLWCIGQGQ